MEEADKKSSTKSLSETASILLDVGLSKPSLSDVKKRSMGNEVPAKAAEPVSYTHLTLPTIYSV